MFSFVGTRLMHMSMPSSRARDLGENETQHGPTTATCMNSLPNAVHYSSVVKRPSSAFSHSVLCYRVVRMHDDPTPSQLAFER